MVPLPLDANVILPGWLLASAISSCTDLAGTDGCTTSTLFSKTSEAMGAKSLFGSKGILAYSAGLIAWMALVIASSV